MRLAIAVALGSGLLAACNQVSTPTTETPEASVPTGWTVISTTSNPANTAQGAANLNAVSGVSDTAVWVVGDRGSIGHWNGTTLLWEPSGTTVNLRGVWALDAEDAYAVGDRGTILERTASGWHPVGAGVTLQVLTAVWADTTRVVAVGSNGTVILGGAAGYQLIATTHTENLFGVTGTLGGPVTMVGALGIVLSLNGTTLALTTLPNSPNLPSCGTMCILSGATTGPNNSYFVGQEGIVFRVDATGLNNVAGCPPSALRSVATVGANAWIVGWDGTICKIEGATATSFPYSDTRWFNGIYAASASSLWVVGASGTLFHGLPLAMAVK
jgi:photosystem II stability/assembly factor-like uncharacterized protein